MLKRSLKRLGKSSMELEIVKPDEATKEFQKLFSQTDKEAILCLTKEVEELHAKIALWKDCADDLIDYARESLADLETWGKGYPSLELEMERVRKAITKYNELQRDYEKL